MGDIGYKMKYKVGDRVKVVKKYNKYFIDDRYAKMKIPSMTGIISSIWSGEDNNFCYFLDHSGIGFEYKDLELIEINNNVHLEDSIHSRYEILDFHPTII